MELARGEIEDRPWGQTFGALGLREITGQLTLQARDGKLYCVAFDHGAVIGATSPLIGDSAARIAFTNHLITSSQVAEIAEAVAAHPEHDELEVLSRACGLDPELVLRLRKRVIAQRAGRTFAVESGSFVLEDQVTIPTAAVAAVDLRAVVYLGVRMNLSEQRLSAELSKLGSRFALRSDAIGDLAQFGLTSVEGPILDVLRRGTTLTEIETHHRELDPRSVQAVIYALVSCCACDATQPPREPLRIADGTQPPPIGTPAASLSRFARASSSPPPSRTRTPSNAPEVTVAPPPSPRAYPTQRDRPVTYAPSTQRAEPPSASREPGAALDPLAAAATAFHRGQAALRDDQIITAVEELTRAVELNPRNFDYAATLAWAQFCGASDKHKIAERVRKMLGHAIQKSLDPELARFYLGRMERMLGRDREALRHFHEVLDADPRNAEAASEIRVIESRLAAQAAEKPGFAGLFGRKKS